MNYLFQQLINGISLGSIYALIALGYTMVYGIIKLINFAHGDIYMVGAYVGYTLIRLTGMGIFPAILVAMVFCGVLGVITEKIAYKPLRHATRIATLITAIGVSYLLENVMIYLQGPQIRSFPSTLKVNTYHLGTLSFNSKQLLIVGTTIVLMVGLQFIIRYTKMGKAMRAVSTDADAALLMGINVDNVISFTFILGSALAGAAGVLVGIFYNSISPLMGVTIGMKAFVAAVLGGIGLVPGAMAGGYLIGITETLVSAYGGSMFKDAVVYFILIIILIIKPSGIFGKNGREKV